MNNHFTSSTAHLLCNRALYVHGKRFFVPLGSGAIKAGTAITVIPDPSYDRTVGKKETWNYVDTGITEPTAWENVTKKVWAYPHERTILFQGEYLVEYLDPSIDLLVETTLTDPDEEDLDPYRIGDKGDWK